MTQTIKKVLPDIKWLFNYMASILLYSIIILLLLVGGLLIAYVVDSRKNAQDGEWRPPLYNAYIIVSQSMTPAIKVNDAIIIKRLDAEDLNVGDVITYYSQNPDYYGIMITHRILEKIKNNNGTYSFVMKGDYNLTQDPLTVSENQVYGKVIMRIPKIGIIQTLLSSYLGWIFGIILPVGLIISIDVVKFSGRIKNHKRSERRKKRLINHELAQEG
ncbi:MAG: signal peptidase I [Bacilli bacterium]|nr:signal peptidase I [Bacilli bacterium]